MKKSNKTPLGWFFEPKDDIIGYYIVESPFITLNEVKYPIHDFKIDWSATDITGWSTWATDYFFTVVGDKNTLNVTKKEDIKFE